MKSAKMLFVVTDRSQIDNKSKGLLCNIATPQQNGLCMAQYGNIFLWSYLQKEELCFYGTAEYSSQFI
jgi:hypothetical protein